GMMGRGAAGYSAALDRPVPPGSAASPGALPRRPSGAENQDHHFFAGPSRRVMSPFGVGRSSLSGRPPSSTPSGPMLSRTTPPSGVGFSRSGRPSNGSGGTCGRDFGTSPAAVAG